MYNPSGSSSPKVKVPSQPAAPPGVLLHHHCIVILAVSHVKKYSAVQTCYKYPYIHTIHLCNQGVNENNFHLRLPTLLLYFITHSFWKLLRWEKHYFSGWPSFKYNQDERQINSSSQQSTRFNILFLVQKGESDKSDSGVQDQYAYFSQAPVYYKLQSEGYTIMHGQFSYYRGNYPLAGYHFICSTNPNCMALCLLCIISNCHAFFL